MREEKITESERLRIRSVRVAYYATEVLIKTAGLKHSVADGHLVCESESIFYTDKSCGREYYAQTAAKSSDGKTLVGEVFPNESKVYILFDRASGSKVGEFVEKTKMTKWVKSRLGA